MSGVCTAGCPAPRQNCAGVCTAIDSDSANCGACGRGCAAGQTCQSGSCMSVGGPDAGTVDAGRVDSGSAPIDTGPVLVDSGSALTDIGRVDSGSALTDTGRVDSGVASGCSAIPLGSALSPTVFGGSTAGRLSSHTPPATCTDMPAAVSPDVVYAWTAPSSGTFTFDTIGSGFDTVLTVRSGSCTGTALGCSDDIVNATTTTSRLTLALSAGQAIAIIIEGYGTNSGSYLLNITRGAVDGGTPADAGAPDPCAGVTTDGRCASSTIIEYCSVDTGGELPPSLQRFTCSPGERCAIDSGGAATCVASGTCIPGDSRCVGTSLQNCVSGTWSTTACPAQCVDSTVASFCAPAVPTTTTSGQLLYQARGPNSPSRPTDWSATTFTATAQAFTIVSVRQNADGTLSYFDAVTTTSGNSTGGRFTLRVPTTTTASDFLVAFAMASDGLGGIRYVVANPGFAAPGTQPPDTRGANPNAWAWLFQLNTFVNGGTLTITESMGSGAARIFDYLRFTYDYVTTYLPGSGRRLVAWMQLGTSWTCGACFSARPVSLFGSATSSGQLFESQAWFNGSTADQEYWSDSVTAHEFGHWVMSSYGTSPGEAGRHTIGGRVYPGMAWSEGWATYFSSDARRNPVYSDKQGGTFFWIDIAARSYRYPAWVRPVASAGLEQTIDENEVAAMLWSVRASSVSAPSQLLSALASPQMQGPSFNRGYRAWSWTSIDAFGTPVGAMRTSRPAPYLADFLDALVCSGFGTAAVNAATQPSVYYPYPSASPLCF